MSRAKTSAMTFKRRAAVLLAIVLVGATLGCHKVRARMVAQEANGLYRGEKYDEAIQMYRKALEEDPSLTRLYRSIGLAYMAQFQPASQAEKDKALADEAIKAFKTFIESNPDDPSGPENLERMYIAANRHDDAIAHFKAKLEKNPNDIDSVARLAMVHQKKGDVREALMYRQKQADLTPEPAKKAEALYTIGAIAWDRSFNYPNLDPAERDQLLELGLAAVQQASQIRADYVEALTYTNLLYREKAKYEMDALKSDEFRRKADEYRAQAQALVNKARAAREAEAKKAAEAAGTPPAATP